MLRETPARRAISPMFTGLLAERESNRFDDFGNEIGQALTVEPVRVK
ncbi:hypothetical protein GCM10023084_67800 [Streptomyces lacrimifluminis]